LLKALEEITKVKYGLENLPSDLMAIDIRSLVSFGTITGQVTNDELLGNILLLLHRRSSHP
jgi:tRNA modification GTPase